MMVNMILGFAIATPLLTAGGALIGLVFGSYLRSREWLKQKRLEVYENLLGAAGEVLSAGVGRVSAKRLADRIASERPEMHDDPEVTRITTETNAKWNMCRGEFLVAANRVRLVADGSVVAALDETGRAMNLIGSAVTSDESSLWDDASKAMLAAQAAFSAAAKKEILGMAGWTLRRRR